MVFSPLLAAGLALAPRVHHESRLAPVDFERDPHTRYWNDPEGPEGGTLGVPRAFSDVLGFERAWNLGKQKSAAKLLTPKVVDRGVTVLAYGGLKTGTRPMYEAYQVKGRGSCSKVGGLKGVYEEDLTGDGNYVVHEPSRADSNTVKKDRSCAQHFALKGTGYVRCQNRRQGSLLRG
jgi:hypothetical protein